MVYTRGIFCAAGAALTVDIGMYGPPRVCKRKLLMTDWSAQMYSAFVGIYDPWP
jgi:hypothetical protein